MLHLFSVYESVHTAIFSSDRPVSCFRFTAVREGEHSYCTSYVYYMLRNL
jgi:hypothetical protein